MKIIKKNQVEEALIPLIIKAGIELPSDIKDALDKAISMETGRASQVLNRCRENLIIAKDKGMPFCQDTGMVLIFVDQGEDCRVEGGITPALHSSVEKAYEQGFFRKSVVKDPLKDRKNTGNNLPPVIHHSMVPGDKLTIRFLLKGFGSENCSRLYMLKPTEGRQGVIDVVVRTMFETGGSPCPPVVLGVGIGGTMDYAAKLSKQALFRDLQEKHPDPWYAQLEQDMLDSVNDLGIGGGGLGGDVTALGVKIASYPTHIAGLPVAVSVNCWADRKCEKSR
ncbi:MAG: fumarate hydratase [Spirochaetaceae bacterium]|jgi:fumarate hydratase subunit alpha|nr:fumarate hydratase [Spirochaetaceae bacterium]